MRFRRSACLLATAAALLMWGRGIASTLSLGPTVVLCTAHGAVAMELGRRGPQPRDRRAPDCACHAGCFKSRECDDSDDDCAGD